MSNTSTASFANPDLGGYYATMVEYTELPSLSWEASVMLAGRKVATVSRHGANDVRIWMTGPASDRAVLDEQAAAWAATNEPGAGTPEFVTHLMTLVVAPDLDADIDISALRAFIASRLEDDLNIATAAGHGFGTIDARRDPGKQPQWTKLDESNVRLAYDVRFLDRWNPTTISEQLAATAQLVLGGDVATALTIVQQWGEHPNFDPSWARARGTARPHDLIQQLRIAY